MKKVKLNKDAFVKKFQFPVPVPEMIKRLWQQGYGKFSAGLLYLCDKRLESFLQMFQGIRQKDRYFPSEAIRQITTNKKVRMQVNIDILKEVYFQA